MCTSMRITSIGRAHQHVDRLGPSCEPQLVILLEHRGERQVIRRLVVDDST